MTLAVCTDVGRVRDQNEDRWLLFDLNARRRLSGAAGEEQPLALPGYLLAVADGMGGMTGGERASQICVDTLAEEVSSKLDSQAATPEAVCRILVEAVREANRRIHREAMADKNLSGMGTTLTATVVGAGTISIVQVGDSRAYRVRGNEAQQLTRDQTIWESMLAAGQNPEQGLAKAPWKNMLVQAVGAQEKVEPVLSDHELQTGDALVLCSDGLHRVVNAADIAGVSARENAPAAMAQALVALANERGGPDNVTVIVGRVQAR